MSLVLSDPCRMSLSLMSHVDFEIGPCHHVKFKGQGPSFGMKGDVGGMVLYSLFFIFFLPFLLSDLEISAHSSVCAQHNNKTKKGGLMFSKPNHYRLMLSHNNML